MKRKNNPIGETKSIKLPELKGKLTLAMSRLTVDIHRSMFKTALLNFYRTSKFDYCRELKPTKAQP